MTDLLDRSITESLGELVSKAPAAGPMPTAPVVPIRPRSTRRTLLPVAAALALVGVAGIVAAAASRHGSSPSAPMDGPATPSSAPDPDDATTDTTMALAPAGTLPPSTDLTDIPITVGAGSPVSWYRPQPDLDLTWRQLDDGSAGVCWRTPATEGCRPEGSPDPLAVESAGDQTLVVLMDDATRRQIDVELSDGTIQTATVEWDEEGAVGVARLALADGVSVVGVGTQHSASGEPDTVTGATLAPALDLMDVPLTVPSGAALLYWRFLPDLDIAERATDAGAELCWRTPAGTGCMDDSFNSPEVGIIPTDGAAIFLARPSLVPIEPPPTDPMAPWLMAGPTPTAVDVTFSDGTTATVALRQGESYGIGFARMDVPAGLTIATATSR